MDDVSAAILDVLEKSLRGIFETFLCIVGPYACYDSIELVKIYSFQHIIIKMCHFIAKIDQAFCDFIPAEYELEVVVGTHPIPQNYYLTHHELGTWQSARW